LKGYILKLIQVLRLIPGSRAYRLTMMALMCAVTAVMAQVRFNVGPIPYTMQNVGVILSGLLLPPAYAAGAMSLYLMLIALGLPLAAGFAGGPSVILGYCGGYLVGFVISAFLMSLLSRAYLRIRGIGLGEVKGKDFAALLALSFVAILPTYILGFIIFSFYALPGSALYGWSAKVSSWLGLGTHGVLTLLIASVLIFIPQDLLMDHVIAIAVAKSVAGLLKSKGVGLV